MAAQQVTILYPNPEGATFDMDYFLNKHIPLAVQKTSPTIKSWTITQFTASDDGSRPAYFIQAIAQLTSAEDYKAAVDRDAGAVFDDIKNFTNVQPVVMYGEAKASG